MIEKEYKKLLNSSEELAQKYLNHKVCMAYDNKECKGRICEAHIISEKYLRNIANNNHIYMPKGSLFNQDFHYEFVLKGVNRATCITGFCEHHDNVLFESFEKKEFKPKYEQIYALTFRALCREFFQKQNSLRLMKDISQGKVSHGNSELFKESIQYQKYDLGIKKQVVEHRLLYTRLKRCVSTGLKFLWLEIENFPIATTGIFFPMYTADGEKIQRIDHKLHGFIYNFITLKNITYIIIATVTSHTKLHNEYLKSIFNLNDRGILNYLITYVFLNNDCIAINPSWFDGLEDNRKSILLNLMNFQIGSFHETGKFNPVDFFSPVTTMPLIKIKKLI